MSDPKGFMRFRREEIRRRPVAARLKDWNEGGAPPEEELLTKQSARCMDCGVAFCQGDHGCPVNNQIPEWNSLVDQGRWQEASVRLHATNNFPEFTGRLCPAPCESACVLGVHSEPVNIKGIEWGIVDRAFTEGWIAPQKAKRLSGRSVAVVGSGPAGLACAQQLARAGHEVTVFEKAPLIGGLLRYGIPDFKLQKRLIDRRLMQMVEEGVTFRTNAHLGDNLDGEQLREGFDAVVLATGAEAPRDLNVPGRALKGIHFAMDYLIDQNRLLNGETEKLSINAARKKVIVLGGGDTGSDCLGTALRQGAREVLQFEIQNKPPEKRDPRTPWPLWPMKLKSSHAHEEGGLREWSLATEAFTGEDGKVTGLRARRLDTQEEVNIAADMVILALGFTGARAEIATALPGLELTEAGRIRTDAQQMTTVEGVFAAGDNRRGASLIVWAIAEGRRLAYFVDRYLKA